MTAEWPTRSLLDRDWWWSGATHNYYDSYGNRVTEEMLTGLITSAAIARFLNRLPKDVPDLEGNTQGVIDYLAAKARKLVAA